LVVVADHVAHAFPWSECYFADDMADSIPADAIEPLPTGPREFDGRPALLRLARPGPGGPLGLPVNTAAPGSPVFVLFYRGPDPSMGMGRLLGVDGDWLRYDANTIPGSSGGPVFDIGWNLIGMHVKAAGLQERKRSHNEGLTLAAVLDRLRASSAWPEVAAFHKLADVAAAMASLDRLAATQPAAAQPPDDPHLKAAVLWRFAPGQFDPDTRDWLKPRVANPASDYWVLLPEERAKLLRAAGSLDALRRARGQAAPTPSPGQRAVDCLLAGPPYPLAEVPFDDLPYWLQAVRWFGGVLPDVPTPVAVNRELGRRGVTDRLTRLVGPTFRGRADELARLRAWDQGTAPGPLVVFGIGGVGKSALVARFADEVLRQGRVVLWLDFDRADLAPDDAVSVLAHLTEQAGVQLEGFVPPAVSKDIGAAAKLGAELARLTPGKPPLLVLDGFEIAQHVRQHTELWPVLDAVLAAAPAVRTPVVGRAPVPALALAGRPAERMEIKGIDRADAAAWLRDGGIPDGPVQDRLLDVSDRVPLALKLAVKLKADGGRLEDLPADLPRALIHGYLYQRVLDRVIDPGLRDLARGALVLRRVTPDLLEAVLGDLLPPDLPSAAAFERLTAELALIETDPLATGPVLRARPEVRTPSLKLLEIEDEAWVQRIDRKAANWYAGRDPEDLVVAAERVYHLLRLGEYESADLAWRDGCDQRLLFAEADLPAATAGRNWLRKRIEGAGASRSRLTDWEDEAAHRIRDALRRKLDRLVKEILSERKGRSPTSPLRVYDAYLL
jgi:hypothetical protein